MQFRWSSKPKRDKTMTNVTDKLAKLTPAQGASKMTKQRTFYVDDQKITIKTRRLANARGHYVFINGERFFSNLLESDLAEDSCYVKWVQKQPCDETGRY